MTANTELTIPNTTHPFFITVDASLVGLGAVLFQMNEENKMKVISYNSRILNTQEQKFSTLDRELLAIVYALQIYEFLPSVAHLDEFVHIRSSVCAYKNPHFARKN